MSIISLRRLNHNYKHGMVLLKYRYVYLRSSLFIVFCLRSSFQHFKWSLIFLLQILPKMELFDHLSIFQSGYHFTHRKSAIILLRNIWQFCWAAIFNSVDLPFWLCQFLKADSLLQVGCLHERKLFRYFSASKVSTSTIPLPEMCRLKKKFYNDSLGNQF